MEQETDTPQEIDPESSTPTQESQVTAAYLRRQASMSRGRTTGWAKELPIYITGKMYGDAVVMEQAASALEALQAEVERLKSELEEAKVLPPEGQRYSFRWCDGDFDYEVAIDGETGEWGWFVETVADPTDPEDSPRLVAEDTREQQVETMHEAIAAARTAAQEVRDER